MTDVFLYLTTRGRTSGLPRRIEIWFVEYRGSYYVVAEMREHARWVKNIGSDFRVTFSVGTREHRASVVPETHARARVVMLEAEPELVRSVSALMDEKYGWSDGLLVEIAKES